MEEVSLQLLAQRASIFIPIKHHAPFAYEHSLLSMKDPISSKHIREYISKILNLCKQRHGGDIVLNKLNLIFMGLSPVMCAHPIDFFKLQRLVNDPTPTIKPEHKDLLNSGMLFSDRLEKITDMLTKKELVTFEDVPHSLSDGFVELALSYIDHFTTWKKKHGSDLYGKSWDCIHKLENAMIVCQKPNEIPRCLGVVDRIRKFFIESYGQEAMNMLNAEIIQKNIKLAIDAKVKISKAVSGRELEQHVSLIHRVRNRIEILGGAEAARRFEAEVYPGSGAK